MLNGRIKGKVIRGLRIASGQTKNPPVKFGIVHNNTIALQRPHFETAGVTNFENYFNGTINVDIAPAKFKITNPHHEVTCEWVLGLEESFWLVAVDFEHDGKVHSGHVYYPLPSEVKSHDDNIIEILASEIAGLSYGDEIEIHFPEENIRLV